MIFYKDIKENPEKYIGIEFVLTKKRSYGYSTHDYEEYSGIITNFEFYIEANTIETVYILFLIESGEPHECFIDETSTWAIIEKK